MCVLFTRPQPPKLELHGAEDEEDRDGGAIQRTSSSATTSGLTSAALTGLTFAPSGLTFADTSLRMGEGGSIQTKGVASTPAQDNGEMLVWVWVLGCACVVLYCVCVQCVHGSSSRSTLVLMSLNPTLTVSSSIYADLFELKDATFMSHCSRGSCVLSTVYLMIKLTEATQKKFCGFGNSTVNSNVVSGNGIQIFGKAGSFGASCVWQLLYWHIRELLYWQEVVLAYYLASG